MFRACTKNKNKLNTTLTIIKRDLYLILYFGFFPGDKMGYRTVWK